MVDVYLRDIYLPQITIHGWTHQSPKIFGRLVALLNAGRLNPLVSKPYPLRDIALAQDAF